MAGFRLDILKASILAVVLGISLGAAAYILNVRIGTRVPTTTPGILEAYILKHGLEPKGLSTFYYYNENITILARVKDTWDNPIVGTLITFEINGPPNSNITILQTAKTNSSGFALVNLPAPYNITGPETALGIWTTIVTTEIAGSNITDSLAFEVKSPPTPHIDVYTDRGGNGLNKPSQPYRLNETVELYAEVSNGTGPMSNQLVSFTIYDGNNTLYALFGGLTNTTGLATTTFRISAVSPTGTWQVIATVSLNEQILIDALTFEYLPT